MAEHVVKVPDVGEGIAEAEIVELRVKVGDSIREDEIIAAVMTDKATVEIPSPVSGNVSWLEADVGQTVAIGSTLVKIEDAGAGKTSAAGPAERATTPTPVPDRAALPRQCGRCRRSRRF